MRDLRIADAIMLDLEDPIGAVEWLEAVGEGNGAQVSGEHREKYGTAQRRKCVESQHFAER